MSRQYGITHTNPDVDAIAAAWLLQRFGPFKNCDLLFVHNSKPDLELLQGAAFVVDTGSEYDAKTRFDHHQFYNVEQPESATSLAYEAVINEYGNNDVHHLRVLIEMVNAADNGHKTNGATESRLFGLHALIGGYKRREEVRRLSVEQRNKAVIAYGYQVLDDLHLSLFAREEAVRLLSENLSYISQDKRFLALSGGGIQATYAALEAGAQLVLFFAPYTDQTDTVAVGIQRAEGSDIDCGNLVRLIISREHTFFAPRITDAIKDELRTWHTAETGWFAGRGTPTAPDPRPLECSLEYLAEYIDVCWKR